jgi:hypothetical protein
MRSSDFLDVAVDVEESESEQEQELEEDDEEKSSFLQVYNHMIHDLNENINTAKGRFFLPKMYSMPASHKIIQSNMELLCRAQQARNTINLWKVRIWNTDQGVIFGQQAHHKILYITGTVEQIDRYLENKGLYEGGQLEDIELLTDSETPIVLHAEDTNQKIK